LFARLIAQHAGAFKDDSLPSVVLKVHPPKVEKVDKKHGAAGKTGKPAPLDIGQTSSHTADEGDADAFDDHE